MKVLATQEINIHRRESERERGYWRVPQVKSDGREGDSRGVKVRKEKKEWG